MKINKPNTGNILLAGGLLAVTLPTLLKEMLHIADFFRGFMLGFGLTMEVVGIILMKRQKSPACNSTHVEIDG